MAFFSWDTVYTKEDPVVRARLENPSNFPKIWLVPAAGGEAQKLITDKVFCYHLNWSPNSTQLAYTFDAKGSSLYSEDHQLAVIDILTRENQILTSNDNFANLPVWSPDGQKIAYYAGRSKDWQAYLDMNDIWVVDLKTSKHRNITQNLQIQIGGAVGPTEPMFWSKDGSRIYFIGSKGGNSNIYQINVEDGSHKQISYFEGEVSTLSLSGDGQTIAFLKSNFTQWDEVYVADITRGEPTVLTDASKDLKSAPFADIENFHFKSTDGVDIEGFLFKPVGYRPGRKYPLVLDIHGGPSYRWGQSLSRYTPWHLYAQRGYGTLLVNPRGSTGYGEKFLHGNFKDFGGQDYQDLMAGVDYAIANYDADPENLFVTGYSYGGYLTNWIVTQTDRFRAAVSIAGGINFLSSFGQNNPILFETYYGLPWENFQAYLEDSPVSYLANIKTPILLMHGQMDEAVDPSQSREFFTYLQYLGVPSELVIYPREPHTISEPLHVVDFLTRSINWFEKHRKK
jgi:dipeptidyl aminopeptidase/acylaminoacyl peptidase